MNSKKLVSAVFAAAMLIGQPALAQPTPGKNEKNQQLSSEVISMRIIELQQKIADLQKQNDVLTNEQKRVREKSNFYIVALFKFTEADAGKKLQPLVGQFNGLPTWYYNWNCSGPECKNATRGNTIWKKASSKTGEKALPPEKWEWTHVAIRGFFTGAEADKWLGTTDEGQFVRDNAMNVFTTTTTAFFD